MLQKLLIAIAAIGAMTAGFWFSSNMEPQTSEPITAPVMKIQGHILNPARKIAVPPLLKDDGSQLTIADWQQHWSLLFFGYTHCPDICPTTMNVLAQSAKQSSDTSFPKVYFVSVDPKRDSIDMLGEYVKYFDPNFTGVTGEAKMIEALTLQSGVVFMQVPSTSDNKEDYIVDHSASILVINPEGKLQAYLKPPHSTESILKSLKTLKDSLQ